MCGLVTGGRDNDPAWPSPPLVRIRYASAKRPNYDGCFVPTNTHKSPLFLCLKTWKASRIEATHFSRRRVLSLEIVAVHTEWLYSIRVLFITGVRPRDSLNKARLRFGGYYGIRWMNVGEPSCGWVQQDIPHCDSAVPPPSILARPNMRMHKLHRRLQGGFSHSLPPGRNSPK